jgi:hypothetical protein
MKLISKFPRAKGQDLTGFFTRFFFGDKIGN